VTQPEAFGAFVSAVCNNVLLESLNKESKHPQIPENAPEPADERVDLDASLITEQRKRVVARILDSLPPRIARCCAWCLSRRPIARKFPGASA